MSDAESTGNGPPTRLEDLSPEQLDQLLQALLAKGSDADVAPGDDRIAPRPGGDAPGAPVPLSFAQERLWFLEQLHPGTAVYNLPLALRLHGPLRADLMRRSLGEIVRRHQVLTTTLSEGGYEEGLPVARLLAPTALDLPQVDLAGLAPEDRAVAAQRGIDLCARWPFRLDRGPLLRAVLFRLSATEHALVLNLHHIAADAWSLGILLRELAALYGGFQPGLPSPLPELPVQYADYAAWQRERLAGERLAGELAYWRQRLAGLGTLEMPTDHPRPAVPSWRGARRPLRLPPRLLRAVRGLCEREGVTPFIALFAAFALLLHRYTGQEDVALGTVLANRGRSEIEGLIGFFANTLVLRCEIGGDGDCRQLLRELRDLSLDAQAHEELPFERLVEELNPERSLAHNPLVQVMFSLQNAPLEGALPGTGLEIERMDAESGTARLDLFLLLWQEGEGLAGTLEHSTDLFDGDSIDRLLGHYETLLSGLAADPGRRPAELPLLGGGERHQLVVEWNDSALPPPAGLVHELIAAQAARTPGQTALTCGDREITYAELVARTGRLAGELRALGLAAEGRVGVCLPRSVEMVVTLVAILAAGGAYVPLDPAYPAERLAFVAADARLGALVTDSGRAGGFVALGVPVIAIDASLPELPERPGMPLAASGTPARRPDAPPDPLAYLLYTSGSTGTPKGVMVGHANVLNFFAAMDRRLGGRPGRWLAVTSISFDISVLELLWTLAHGFTVVVQGDGESGSIPDQILGHAISHLQCTPSAAAGFVLDPAAGAALAQLDRLVLGGEALPEPLAARLAGEVGGELLNLYGPTETTVWSAAERLPRADLAAARSAVTLGRPLLNTELHVLDARLELVATGIPGELYIGGAGVARGYWARPELSAERFLPDPFTPRPGGRLYRTGDRVRRRPDGRLAFLGRVDHQVKIRGHRVEPGEVEAVLATHPGVREAVVAARPDPGGDLRLVAYVVPADSVEPPAVSDLDAHLRRTLPSFFCPEAWVVLAALPLTPNGKIDRKALPVPEPSGGLAPGRQPAAPRSETQAVVAGLWRELLGQDGAGIHDNFFDLGGNSLKIMQLRSRIRSALGVDLPLGTFFAAQTIARQAEHAERARRGAPGPVAPLVRPSPAAGDPPLSFSQERLWFLEQLEPGSPVYNLPAAVRLDGELAPGLLHLALLRIAGRHAVLRTSIRMSMPGSPGTPGPVQAVAPGPVLALPRVDLGALAGSFGEAEAGRLAAAEALLPFDLAAGPLLRTTLLALGHERHVLLVTFHHIATDGWSLGIFFDELAAFYLAGRDGGDPGIPALALQYGDFALWQRGWLQGEELERLLAYWRVRLAGAPAAMELPFDRPRPAVQTYRGAAERLEIAPAVTSALRAFGRSESTTVFMTLLAVWGTLLHRYARQDDLVVGTPTANRTQVELEALIGFFANSLALRLDLGGDPSFRDLLKRVRGAVLDDYAHQEVPFEKLVEALRPERDLSHNPIYQAVFALESAERELALDLPGLRLTALPPVGGTAKFDLALYMDDRRGRLAGLLETNRDLFDRATGTRWLGHFVSLLEGALSDPGSRLSELPLVRAAERHQLLAEANDLPWQPPREPFVHRQFEARAAAAPGAPALSQWEGKERRLTYGEVNRRANQLAHRLRRLGVGPEVRVAVSIERSPELIVALLAVWKAGGAYVPLDPTYPQERLAFLLADSRASVLLTEEPLRARFPPTDAVILAVDAGWRELAGEETGNLDLTASPGNLAYVIYTSGSTGRPKGVMIEHRSLASYTATAIRAYGVVPGDRVLQFCSISFDISMEEIVPCLAGGAELVLRTEAMIESVTTFLAACRELSLSMLSLPTAYWHEITARVEAEGGGLPPSLRLVIIAGERALPERLAAWRRHAPERPLLINTYGLTESTIISTVADLTASPGADGAREVPIGRVIPDTEIYLLDGRWEPVPAGIPGELWIGGGLLARGYLNRPDVTAERFVPHLFSRLPGARLYRTGDLARRLAGGDLEFLGRGDQQVKIRGYRIELGEIETALAEYPAIAGAVAAVREDRPGQKRLVAYLTARPDQPVGALSELRAFLRRRLPDYMLPGTFVFLDALPLTPNGKVDRGALPEPPDGRPDLGEEFVPPGDEIERAVAAIWQEVLGLARVGIHDNFFDLGGHSLLLIQVHDRLRERFGRSLPIVDLFKHPTVGSLARYLGAKAAAPAIARAESGAARQRAWRREPAAEGVAVIGLAGRFPGAASVDLFWENLKAGRETITFWSVEELRASGVDPRLLGDPAYVRARGLIEDPELFDAAFFGLSPREAEIMDPQHRLLLECSWQALEHAGYDSQRYPGRVGLYAGTGSNTYLLFNLYSNPELLGAAGLYQAMLGSDSDFLATRISYKLNLRGPSLTVQTACSTSLVAVHLATQSLLHGECDMALAGGVRIAVPQRAGYLYQPGGIFSPDGHCRPFDAAAEGCLDGDGVGVVVLKRLADALADGDHVHAVIRGSAINNDGAEKIGYTAPSARGQEEAIAMAQAAAGVAPETIGYVEAHGTATPMGDPIEVAALAEVFRREDRGEGREKTCALGSVKGNVGHLDAAAGVAGLIKTVFALEHRQIPPSLHFERPNPQIPFDETPFFVNTRLADWPRGETPRRAGVSSFGIGGTNAHVVLEEAPELTPGGPSRPHQLLLLSAATAPALEARTADLVAHLRRQREESSTGFADLAYTLKVGRRALPHRRMVVCTGAADGVAALDALDPKRVLSRFQEAESRGVAFLFPGQGAQHPGMTTELYRAEPSFRRELDLCAELLLPDLGLDLREALAAASGSDADGEIQTAALAQTALAQPALFAVEYSLARLWMEWGVRPEALLGHSVGELVAACLAGIFTLEEALHLVAERGRLMQAAPPGAMLSVAAAEAEVRELLDEGLEIAAVNTPSLCVVSGSAVAVVGLAARLAERGVQHKRLHTSHAFHSASMEPVLDRFRETVVRLSLQPPRIPFLSNRTGTWIRPEEAMDPDYWAGHLRQPVRFSEGLEKLFAKPGTLLLEVGPGRSLSALARQHPGRSTAQTVLSSLPAANEAGTEVGASSEVATLLRALGQLWLAGVAVDWDGFYAPERRRRLALPTYPFERQRYWVEPQAGAGIGVAGKGIAGIGVGSTPGRRQELADWFYAPLWRQAVPLVPSAAAAASPQETWLVLGGETGLGARLAARLRERGFPVVAAREGDRFAETGERAFSIRPGAPEDYRSLLDHLRGEGLAPRRIAHLWSVDPASAGEGSAPGTDRLDRGFYSLLALAQALGERTEPGPVHLGVLSTGLQRVTGEEALDPLQATLLGPVITMPLELSGVTCQSLDLVLPVPGSRRERELIDLLLAELTEAPPDPIVALRASGRWLRTFEPLRLPPPDSPPAGLTLREEGVYLITGGLGGVGLTLAERLAHSVARVRLVLTGRSPFPPREEWRERASGVAEAAPAGETGAVIRRLLALEDLGAEVLVAAADVTDREAMAGVLALVHQRHGRLHGVIHAAGVPGGGLIQLKTREAAAAVLAPKVHGTLVLAELLAGHDLDFLALVSSLNSILGGPGQVDYAAANAFLDAFAVAAEISARRVLSISSDTWRGLGMAATLKETRGADGAREDREESPLELLPFDHPLLTQRVFQGGDGTVGEEIFLSYLEPALTWILAEHRLGGHAIVPGTAYLEMAGAAFRSLAGNGSATAAIELSDVLFVTPMRVADDERREVRTVLRKNGDGFHFHVQSGSGPAGGGGWQEHVLGAIRETVAQPARFDLAALRGGRSERVLGEEYQEDLREVGLGPRWESLKRVYVGDEGVLGLLELAPEFSADLDQFELHPALLDIATSFGEAFAPRGEGYYLPLSYRRLRAFGRLPRRLWSYARFKRAEGGSTETIAFDIAILDDEGVERVQVEEFTLKRIDVAGAIRARSAPGAPIAPLSGTGTGGAVSVPGGGDGVGMTAAEGAEAFLRVLARSPLPWVAISTHPLAEVIEQARASTLAELARGGGGGTGTGHARPNLDTAYVAPRNELESRLAALWQEVLGIAAVGVFDDFFELGGHSLLGTQLVSRVRAELRVEVPLARLFEAATVAELSLVIEALRVKEGGDGTGAAAPSADTPELVRAPRSGPLPLSFAQQRLWFLDRLEPGSAGYNMPRGLRLGGTLGAPERAALAASFTEIARRHETLRTTFSEVGGEPVQVVAPPAPLPLPLVDLGGLHGLGDPHREAWRLAREAARQPFDLARGPLIRTLLVRLSPAEHLLSVVMHHIVTDGWSMGVFVGETWALYPAFRAGLPSPLPELALQYGDFALWQRRRLAGRELDAELEYWRDQLANVPEELNLPLDRPRPAVEAFRGAIRTFAFPPELSRSLIALARRHGATQAMTLLAGFQALLGRYSGQEDIAVGMPIAGRNRREVEGLIGFFVNTLVFRGIVSGGSGFGSLLDRVRQTSLAAYSHQDLPFERLVEELHPTRTLRRPPLFQVMFGFETLASQALEMPGLTLAPLEEEAIDTGTSKFDLTMLAFEQDGNLAGVLEYNAGLLEDGTIVRFLQHFENLLAQAVADPARPLRELEILSPGERAELVREWNDAADFPWTLEPETPSVLAFFETQVARAPEAIALEAGEEALSYGELEARTNRLARHLTSLGVEPESTVGICLERSLDLPLAVLAVLKAGAAYVPLDPSYPPERLRWMVEDARPAALVSTADLPDRLPADAGRSWAGGAVVRLDREARRIAHQSALRPAVARYREAMAYVLYTSGSTGRPKGIVMQHRTLVNVIGWQVAASGVPRRTLQFTSLAFDVSVQEMFATWAVGAAVVMVDQEVRRDAPALVRLLRERRVERLFLPFVALQQVAEAALYAGLPDALVEVITAGEQLRTPGAVTELFRRLPRCRLENQYGPSETHVVTAFPLDDHPETWPALPPIGRPFTNLQIVLRVASEGPPGALVPVGAPGEVMIAGMGLARGYLDRPDLTAERFLPHSLAGPGARAYRTGDLGRYRADGAIEFIGRIDHQVKIHGFRVELGEIEALLGAHPEVRQALVVAHAGAGRAPRLVVYAAPVPGSALEAAELASYLGASLPPYMVPSSFVLLPALPLDPNGKVDRRALPAPSEVAAPAGEATGAGNAPRTPIEELLAGIWADVLELPGGGSRIGPDDDFFALGGHSLLATRTASRLRQAFGVEVPLRLFFEAPKLSEFTLRIAALTGARSSGPPLVVAAPRGLPHPLSYAQLRLWSWRREKRGGANIPFGARFSGPLDAVALERSLAEVVRRHDVLRASFVELDGEPVQVVRDGDRLTMPTVDLAALPEAHREAELLELSALFGDYPFDISGELLFRATLVRLGLDEHALLIVEHHIVTDGWSQGVLTDELAALYPAYLRGEPSPLPELPIQYADFVVWERAQLAARGIGELLGSWEERLRDLTVLELPTDRPRPAVRSVRGGVEYRRLDAALGRDIRALGQRENASLFMTLLAAWKVVLGAWTGQEDVSLTTNVAGRDRVEVERLIGFFTNVLILRTNLAGDPTFREFLGRVRETTLAAFALQDLPFFELLGRLLPGRSHNEVFPAGFLLQNFPVRPVAFPGISFQHLDLGTGSAPRDLMLLVDEEGEAIGARLLFRTDIFDAATAARLLEGFAALLTTVVRDPEQRLSALAGLVDRSRNPGE